MSRVEPYSESSSVELYSESSPVVQQYATRLLQAHIQGTNLRTNRMFVGLLLFEWIAGIGIAGFLSPQSWTGATSQIHLHVWLAVLLGGGIIAYPLFLVGMRPLSPRIPYVIALAQMLFASLLIHLTGGRLETHFHVFGSLAFLAFYRDWRVLIVASTIAAGDHFLRGVYLPQSIYGDLIPGGWRWVEHTGWILFEDVFLCISIVQSRREMQEIALRQAQIEAANTSIEATVIARTAELRMSEANLRDTEQNLRMILNNARDAILTVDMEGLITEWNPQAEILLGWSKEEAVGILRLATILPAVQGLPLLHNSTASLVTMEALVHPVETVALRRSGEGFSVEMVISPHEQAGDLLLSVFMRDISRRKQAEMALRKSQEKLTFAQQVAQMGSWEYDLVSDKISWSPEMFHLLGIDPDAGEPDLAANLTLFHSDDAALLSDCIQQAAAEGKEYALDLRRTALSDNSIRWYHAVGKVIRNEAGQMMQLVGTLNDISERKKIEEAVRKSEESLNYAQMIAHVGSWEFDARTERMIWSDELFRLCGLEPGTIDPSIEELTAYMHPLDRCHVQKYMHPAMPKELPNELVARLVGSDGVLRYVSIRVEFLTDGLSQITGSRGTLTDVTERVQALQEQAKFVSLVENSSEFIAITSLDGVMLSMNSAGRKLVGLERIEEVATTMLLDFMPQDVWDWMRLGILPLVMRDGRWEGECQLVHVTSGKVHEMQASFFLIRNPVSGAPMCLATVQRDITERKEMDAELNKYLALIQDQNVALEVREQQLKAANIHLEALATTDGLTGAKNRRAFQERLDDEFNRTHRTLQPLSIILMDVDKFKTYNDTYGHPEGDVVLREVARLLHATARETDFVARYGGEEFIILLPGAGKEEAIEAAERFRSAIETNQWLLRQVTASFGIETLNADIDTGQQLVDRADKALYTSKEAGRNRVTHADAC